MRYFKRVWRRIKDKLTEKFMRPKSRLGRLCNVTFVGMSSVMSVYSYSLIAFMLCVDGACRHLQITKVFAKFSAIFLLFSLLTAVVAYFLSISKDLPEIYSDSIALVCVFGFFLIGVTPFMINRELQLMN